MNTQRQIEFNTFRLQVRSDGSVAATGTCDGSPIQSALVLSNDHAIVLTDPPIVTVSSQPAANVCRMSPVEGIVWAAAPPHGPDRFVSLRLEDDEVVVHTFSGYRVVLDAKTGQVLRQTFTK